MDEMMKKAIDDVGAQVDKASAIGEPANPDAAGDKASEMKEEPSPEKVYEDTMADPEKGPVLKEMEAVAGGKDVIMNMLKAICEPEDDMAATMNDKMSKFKEKKPTTEMGMVGLFAEPSIPKKKMA